MTAAADEHAGHGEGEHPAESPVPSAERPHPKLAWTLPAGWEETAPGQMSLAQFQIKAPSGQATVNITPLPNLAGKEAMVVNMWRQQVGQPPLADADVVGALSPVSVAEGKGQLFEIAGDKEGAPTRIVTAMLNRPDGSWFFKLSGGEAAVVAQKPSFLDFLKSVRIGAPPGPVPSDETKPQ